MTTKSALELAGFPVASLEDLLGKSLEEPEYRYRYVLIPVAAKHEHVPHIFFPSTEHVADCTVG